MGSGEQKLGKNDVALGGRYMNVLEVYSGARKWSALGKSRWKRWLQSARDCKSTLPDRCELHRLVVSANSMPVHAAPCASGLVFMQFIHRQPLDAIGAIIVGGKAALRTMCFSRESFGATLSNNEKPVARHGESGFHDIYGQNGVLIHDCYGSLPR